eukprot:TRINITY_DN9354_c0_g1_i1.p1 TRINITY_DN9354_c0_g1~~TRINITY_DN9354_c0_g1_i1.p1  ORF type:complete len:358 (-),score=87.77 TRINITY_DN9354_c0_g1_i1:19-1044(-)
MTSRFSLLVLVLLGFFAFPETKSAVTYTRISVGGGVQLNVALYDINSTKPVILLVHGFPEGMNMWDYVIPKLNEKGEFRLIVPDLRGYNGSDHPEGQQYYTLNLLLNDIKMLLQATVGSERVHLVAHDWGGLIAWNFAHFFPQKLKTLTTINCPHPNIISDLLVNDPSQATAAKYLLGFVHQPWLMTTALSAFNYKGLKSVFPPSTPPSMMQGLVSSWSLSNGVRAMIDYYPANINTPSMFSFKGLNTSFPYPCTISVPTFVLWGLQDPMYIAENIQLSRLQKFVSSVKVQIMPNATHFSVMDEPITVATSIRKFITGKSEPSMMVVDPVVRVTSNKINLN